MNQTIQEQSPIPMTTLAATYTDVEMAREVAKRLKEAGFGNVWIGIAKAQYDDDLYDTSATENEVEADNWFQRAFGEGNESLHDALIRHGVSEAEASTAGKLEPHGAVLTVDGVNHPEEAVEIMTSYRGRLISSGYGATGRGTEGSHPLYDQYTEQAETKPSYGKFRGGETLDSAQRLQLREERLRIERERSSIGEAQVGKRIVEEDQQFDVPVAHEELFIQRRPITESTAAGGAITEEETVVHIPLSSEHIRIEKDTVATEEVVIGKRSVTETQHVSAKTRKELLDVKNDEPSGQL